MIKFHADAKPHGRQQPNHMASDSDGFDEGMLAAEAREPSLLEMAIVVWRAKSVPKSDFSTPRAAEIEFAQRIVVRRGWSFLSLGMAFGGPFANRDAAGRKSAIDGCTRRQPYSPKARRSFRPSWSGTNSACGLVHDPVHDGTFLVRIGPHACDLPRRSR